MIESIKAKFLDIIELDLKNKIKQIHLKQEQTALSIDKLKRGLSTWYRGSDEAETVKQEIFKKYEDIKLLEDLKKSPYFSKLNIDGSLINLNRNDLYFAKHSVHEEGIYSWTSPIARLRLFKPGIGEYKIPSGEIRSVNINHREAYIIRDGQLFYARRENIGEEPIILRDNPLDDKKTFGLSEIIEKLDAYQDDIIRIPAEGSTLISGSAGSGKTTLALHKLAYLRQSLEHKKIYTADKMLIIVQDRSTMKYFSSVLPALQLQDVKISTFEDWAYEILKIKRSADEQTRAEYAKLRSETDYPLLEHAKYLALASNRKLLRSSKSFESLDSLYFDYLDEKSYSIYKKQKQLGYLDRFDLTMLLTDHLLTNDIKINYKLILIDEAENYLSKQLKVFKSFLSRETRSIIYIGDIVQKSFPFTIKSWGEIGENFDSSRKIVLPKVYRITNQIREYLVKLGYQQNQTTKLRDGAEIIEFNLDNTNLLIERINELFNDHKTKKPNNTFGIVFLNSNLKELVRNRIEENALVFDVIEAQGVEFDTVVLIKETQIKFPEHWAATLKDEMKNVYRDRLLVGITRSRNDLIIINLVNQ